MAVVRLAVICGPTAAGKSSLALALAESCGLGIVSADSRQVYRGFDIGSGKVTAEETARGHELAGKYSQMFDLNHDGTLEAGELQRAGARVLVDSNRNGKFENAESQTINNLPSIGYGRASLDYVNPFMANGSVSNRGAWF